jgi:hypothetical protein
LAPSHCNNLVLSVDICWCFLRRHTYIHEPLGFETS